MLGLLRVIRTKGSSISSRRFTTVRNSSTHDGNQGMNAEVFRSVFRPLGPKHPASSNIRDGRYLWRWDWHLRLFIYALIPPACAYAYVLAIRLYTASYAEELRKKVDLKKSSDEQVGKVQVKADTLEERVTAMEQILLSLQAEHERVLSQAVVLEAKSVINSYRQVAREGQIQSGSR